jgi:hypothetical protein
MSVEFGGDWFPKKDYIRLDDSVIEKVSQIKQRGNVIIWSEFISLFVHSPVTLLKALRTLQNNASL